MATFQKRASGYWQARVRRDGYPIRSQTFPTRADAEVWARQQEAEMDRGVYIDRTEAEKNTLANILKRYAREVSPTKRGKDLEIARIAALCEEKFTHTKMAALSTSQFAEWRDKRLQCVSGSTVNRELNIMSAAINRARKEWGVHCDNPIALLSRPKENKARERRLVDDEEQRLLSALDCPPREKGKIRSTECVDQADSVDCPGDSHASR